MSRILVAPNSYKGSVSASVAALAIARGWASIRPSDEIVVVPMGDGGDGTLEVLSNVAGATPMHTTVPGPDDSPVEAQWLLLPGGTAIVELASASGLVLLDSLRPFHANTFGFGRLISTVLDTGVSRLLLGIGGSGSTDGGAGALVALGARLLSASGAPVPLGNRGLASLTQIDLSGLRSPPPDGVVVLSDVTNPLLGPRGAAAVFGPQKGATPDDIPLLEANLERFADLLGGDPGARGAGAAGGTGFGLMAWGAALLPGSAAIGDILGMPAKVASADLVITGEGRFDSQSAEGKVPGYIEALAARANTAAALVAGSITAPTQGFAQAVSLVDLAGGLDAARSDAEHWMREAGARLAERF